MCPMYLHFLGTIRLKGKNLGGFALIGLYRFSGSNSLFSLSMSFFPPLSIGLGWGYQVGGIAIVFFSDGGMTLINFCFFFF